VSIEWSSGQFSADVTYCASATIVEASATPTIWSRKRTL